MPRTRVILITAGVVAALAGGGAAIAGAAGGDDDANDKPISGAALQRASDAALAEVPGKVTETESGDEEGAYEVEVTKADGTEVDVHLDGDFRVLDAQPEGRD